MILLLGIKDSMRDLISDVSYCTWAVFARYRLHDANDVWAPSCIITFD